jgi:hypothetical protein
MALHIVERYAMLPCAMCVNTENVLCAQATQAFIPVLEQGAKNLVLKRDG